MHCLSVNIENGNRQRDKYMIPDIIYLATALDVWSGQGELRGICFLDDWKHVVQCTELGRSERRTSGSRGKLFDSI